jgi:hypothetical protein
MKNKELRLQTRKKTIERKILRKVRQQHVVPLVEEVA